jgi:hypothetical protein
MGEYLYRVKLLTAFHFTHLQLPFARDHFKPPSKKDEPAPCKRSFPALDLAEASRLTGYF